jgi:hypothetical protein
MLRRLVLLASVSACGLFPDLGSLSGDAGGNDAAPDVTTQKDATPDVTNDTTTTDVTPPGDAGLDVKTSPCTVKHTFCDDFDDGSIGAAWDKVANGVGGTVSQSTNAVSPPFAFQAQVPAGPGHPYAALEKDFPAAQHIHFEFDMIIIGSQATDIEIDYFDFSFQPSGYIYGDFNLERRNPGGTSEEGSQTTLDASTKYNDDDLTEELTSWKHVVIDLDFGKSTYTVVVDGTTIDAMSMNPPLASAQGTFSIGATYTGALTSQWTIITDNVVVDLQ